MHLKKSTAPIPAEAAALLRDALERSGKRLVFTSGCFDILHAGHVRYLRQARALGDALLVAVNSDSSVRSLKGPQRPVNAQDDRAEVLLGLESVDAVVVFEDLRTTGLIRAVRPHVFAKGGDYTIDSLNPEERAALEQVGAVIHILPEVKGKSTTATLERMQAGSSRKLRLGIVGSGAGTNYQAIADAIAAGTLDAEVALVVSDRKDSLILQRAKAAGHPVRHIDPGPHRSLFPSAAQQALCEHLLAARVDLVVLAGFMRVVKEPLLSAFAGRIINLHPSLLPAHRGLNAVASALAAGDKKAGCTVHYVDAGVDTGEIIAQATVPIQPGDTESTLAQRIHEAEHRLLPLVIRQFAGRTARDAAGCGA